MKKIISNINTNQAIKFICLLIVFLSITAIAAHASGPVSPGGDVDAPIDGGLSLLVAGGVGYAAKKLREKRKSSSPRGE